MKNLKIAVIPGSIRSDSCNVRLGNAIVQHLESQDTQVTFVNLRDYPMPIYDGDLESKEGVPSAAIDLASLLSEHAGIILVSPEYNSSISPLLKNTLDWLSRDVGDHTPYKNRVYGLSSCSPGALGGIRGLMHLRFVLMNGGVEVITPQLCVGGSSKAFDDSGNLVESRHQSLLSSVCSTLIKQASFCLES